MSKPRAWELWLKTPRDRKPYRTGVTGDRATARGYLRITDQARRDGYITSIVALFAAEDLAGAQPHE